MTLKLRMQKIERPDNDFQNLDLTESLVSPDSIARKKMLKINMINLSAVE